MHMHDFATRTKSYRTVSAWVRDNQMFMDAYYAANRDAQLKADIEKLEASYIRKHLSELVGATEAERIMSERGY